MKMLRPLATLLLMSTSIPWARSAEPVTAPVRDASGFVGWLPSQSVASTPVPGAAGISFTWLAR